MNGRYLLTIKSAAERDLDRVPRRDYERIRPAIENLAVEPRPHQSIKMTARNEYRLRVGDYRVLYTIDDRRQIVVIVGVSHRRDVYRDR